MIGWTIPVVTEYSQGHEKILVRLPSILRVRVVQRTYHGSVIETRICHPFLRRYRLLLQTALVCLALQRMHVRPASTHA